MNTCEIVDPVPGPAGPARVIVTVPPLTVVVMSGFDELALKLAAPPPPPPPPPPAGAFPPIASTEPDCAHPSVMLDGCTVSGVGGTGGAAEPSAVLTVTVVRALLASVMTTVPFVMHTCGFEAVTRNRPGLWFTSTN